MIRENKQARGCSACPIRKDKQMIPQEEWERGCMWLGLLMIAFMAFLFVNEVVL